MAAILCSNYALEFIEISGGENNMQMRNTLQNHEFVENRGFLHYLYPYGIPALDKRTSPGSRNFGWPDYSCDISCKLS